MYKLFKKIARGYNQYMIHMGRERARQGLLGLNDRLLQDNGFSRELLEAGTQAWPWLMDAAQGASEPLNLKHLRREKAVSELESYSDRELLDLGIARGSIRQVVESGRPGIDEHGNDAQAA